MKFGGSCAVLRLDDVGGVVGRAEVAGVVGGGHAAGLPLVLAQVLLEVAGVGVGRAAELAGVDGGRGICDILFRFIARSKSMSTILSIFNLKASYCSTWTPCC